MHYWFFILILCIHVFFLTLFLESMSDYSVCSMIIVAKSRTSSTGI